MASTDQLREAHRPEFRGPNSLIMKVLCVALTGYSMHCSEGRLFKSGLSAFMSFWEERALASSYEYSDDKLLELAVELITNED